MSYNCSICGKKNSKVDIKTVKGNRTALSLVKMGCKHAMVSERGKKGITLDNWAEAYQTFKEKHVELFGHAYWPQKH